MGDLISRSRLMDSLHREQPMPSPSSSSLKPRTLNFVKGRMR